MNKYQALGMALCIVSAVIVLVAIVAFVPIKLLVDCLAAFFLLVVVGLSIELIYHVLKGPK